MPRKPSPPAPSFPPPPPDLAGKYARMWRSAVRNERNWPATRLEMLHQAILALVRADQAKAVVDAEGLTSTTAATGAIHIHPAVKTEREMRAQAMRGLELLGLLTPLCKADDFEDEYPDST